MAVADVGSSSVFQSPGASPAPQAKAPPPAPPAANDDDDKKAQQTTAQAPNTNPSDDDRKKAEEAGKTRGSFVNVQA
jgi:hypothetical protein